MSEVTNRYADRADFLDREDSLREFKDKFVSNDKKLIYLDGNSLGKLPLSAKQKLDEIVDKQWGSRMIRSWNENWWDMPLRSASKISRLIGAGEEEVVVCDSTSVNLFKLATAALNLNHKRKKIVSEELNFPTDLYILQGIIENMNSGHQLLLAKAEDNGAVNIAELERLIDTETALVVLTLVSYRSAYLYDIKKITEIAHRNGALVIWDLCHAVGVVPIDLKDSCADMAVGCTYKYLNCGPGSPAFLFVRKDLQKKLKSPIWGWFGDDNPFAFNLQYKPANSIKKYMSGTSGILSMCTIEPSLDIVLEAGLERIRSKSLGLTGFFIEMYHAFLKEKGFILGTPEDPEKRGSHIVLRHPEAFRISKALIDPDCGDRVVIPDFRPPDNLRFGFAPLYNTFLEVVILVEELIRLIDKNLIESYSLEKDEVT